MAFSGTPRLILAVLLLFAAGLRVAACAYWNNDLSLDPDAYRGLAERLLESRGYVSPDGSPTAFRPPLYPMLLTSVLWAGPLGVAVLHVLLGTATVLLTALLGEKLGLGRGSPVAAALVAIDPLLIRYTPQVMTEVTCALLAILVLWLAVRHHQSLTSTQTGLSFGLGLAFGLAVLSRPTFWVFGAFTVPVWFVARFHKRDFRGVPWLVAFFVLLVVSPWVVRNAVVLGKPVLTTTHGGYTLLLANNPIYWREVVAGKDNAWRGPSLARWQQSLERSMAADHIEGELARDRWMANRAKEHIRENPTLFLRSVLHRIGRFWALRPSGPAADELPQPALWLVAAYYAVLHALAVWGAIRQILVASAQRTMVWGLPLLLIASFTAVHAVYWTDARMRAPLIPAVALFAIGALNRSRATSSPGPGDNQTTQPNPHQQVTTPTGNPNRD